MKPLILIGYFISSFFYLNAISFISQFNSTDLNINATQNSDIDYILTPINCEKNIFECDSSCQKRKYKFFQFDDKLNNLNKMDIDSLIKKYKFEIDIEKYFNKDFFKKFEENSPRFWQDFPKFDKRDLDVLLKDLDKNLDKDSLLNRFKFFRKKDLFDNSELIEI